MVPSSLHKKIPLAVFVSLSLSLQLHTLPLWATAPEPFAQSRIILHTLVEIKAYGDHVERAVADAFSEMERINRLLNNYDPASEVSRINRAAGGEGIAVSPETIEALAGVKCFSDLSGGALDITIGPLLELWGFTKEEPGIAGVLPSPEALHRTLKLVNYRLIELDAIKGIVRLPQAGMWLDTGSFTKGFAADKAAQLLKARGITQALIAAGGTIVAIGKKPDGKRWLIGIKHPRSAEGLADMIQLENQSVSTSGDYERFYNKGGRRLCHIIDPRVGEPVAAVQSVSVIAPTALASDALSTALFVLGAQDGIALTTHLPGVEAMIIDQHGKRHISPGWPALQEDVYPNDA